MALETVRTEKLPHPESSGEDEMPFRFAVYGPGTEIEKFCTLKDALIYSKLRQSAANSMEAIQQFWTAKRSTSKP
jgi:hypothetical protein